MRFTLLRAMLLAGAAISAGVALWLAIPYVIATQTGPSFPDAGEVITTSSLEPSERTPQTLPPSSDKPNAPYQLIIPALHLTAPIQNVGLDQEDRIAVPSNIHFAGWFTQSDRPGSDGLTILDGHVHGRYVPGVFHQLHTLSAGDEIIITQSSGLRHRYIVSTRSTVSAENNKPLFDTVTEPTLRLITCSNFNASTQSYDDRLIVTATLQK